MTSLPISSTPAAPGRILLVDDDEAVRTGIRRFLAKRHEVIEAPGGREALDALQAGRFDLVLSDIHMPGVGGLELLRGVRKVDLDVPVVLFTGQPDLETAIRAIEYGALEYLTKPVPLAHLEASVDRAIRLGRLARVKRSALDAAGHDPVGAGDRAGTEASFEGAIASMWPAFQPIVNRKGELYGHEALMRTQEPTLPHPGAVIEAAERLGRLPELGARMRELTARDAAEHATAGIVFVNLHPLDLEDARLFAADAPLAAHAHRVVLEITERMSLDGVKEPRARIAELRARGYRIAVDDLGAGYAGLNSFASIQPEIVKLDLSLVRDVDTSIPKQKVIRSMASLCRELGALVVGECVETKGELEFLLDLGCDLFQGYLIGRPGPAFPARTWPLT